MITVMMGEYTGIRSEIASTLTAQVQVLTFGAAAVGLLGTAALGDREGLVAGLLMLFGIPLVCFLALAVHGGEVIRIMRAGLFLHQLENCLNKAQQAADSSTGAEQGKMLTWEQWGSIRNGRYDIDKLNRIAVGLVFVALAVGFAISGYYRLEKANMPSEQLCRLGIGSAVLGAISIAWLIRLAFVAYGYRQKYDAPDGSAGTDIAHEKRPARSAYGCLPAHLPARRVVQLDNV